MVKVKKRTSFNLAEEINRIRHRTLWMCFSDLVWSVPVLTFNFRDISSRHSSRVHLSGGLSNVIEIGWKYNKENIVPCQ